MYRVLFKMIFQLTLFISAGNYTIPLLDIVKVESLSVERSVFSELYKIYEVNRDLSTKQWSLAFEPIKIRIFFNIFISVQNTISSSDNHFLGICFPILLSILYSIYLIELENSMILKVGFWKEDNGSSSTLRWISPIIMSIKTCCSFIFVVVVMFVYGASLNLFWWVLVTLSFDSPFFLKLCRNYLSLLQLDQ